MSMADKLTAPAMAQLLRKNGSCQVSDDVVSEDFATIAGDSEASVSLLEYTAWLVATRRRKNNGSPKNQADESETG